MTANLHALEGSLASYQFRTSGGAGTWITEYSGVHLATHHRNYVMPGRASPLSSTTCNYCFQPRLPLPHNPYEFHPTESQHTIRRLVLLCPIQRVKSSPNGMQPKPPEMLTETWLTVAGKSFSWSIVFRNTPNTLDLHCTGFNTSPLRRLLRRPLRRGSNHIPSVLLE